MFKYRQIGERLRLLRGDRSQEAFAQLLGLRRPVYRRYETGEREPPVGILVKLAKQGRTTVDWILTGKSEGQRFQRLPTIVKEPGAVYGEPSHVPDCRAVPMLRRRVTGGPPKSIGESDIEAYAVLPAAWTEGRQFIVRMADDSMEPVLQQGDLVGIEELSGKIESQQGRVIAAWLKEPAGLTIKRLGTDTHYWILAPDNRAYRPIVVPKRGGKLRFFRVAWWLHRE